MPSPSRRSRPRRIQQVGMNLVTNARDAVKARGEICIETRDLAGQAGGVQLIVRDTGPRIPPEILPKIFDPFFTTKAEGAGLTTFVLTLRRARPGDLA